MLSLEEYFETRKIHIEYRLKLRWLQTYPQKALQIRRSLDKRLRECQCIFENKILPVPLMPLLLNESEFDLFKYTSEILYRAIHKIIHASYSSARIRQNFGYEEIPKEWLKIDPGYDNHIAITRLDALFANNQLKYIEFNTDNPGGEGWNDTIRNIVATHPFYKSLVSFPQRELQPITMEKALAATKAMYQKFCKGTNIPPTVAFVDYRDSKYDLDARLNMEFCNQNGINAILADPRDFSLQNGAAYVKKQKIDLVRRYMKAQEFLDYPDEIKTFIKGYLTKAFCMVNSFRSVYGSEKSLLAMMSNSDYHDLFDEEELAVIKKHIPWTRVFTDAQTTSPSGKKITLEDFVKKHRDKLLVKPSWGHGGKGVRIGKFTSQAEWEKDINDHLGNKDWVVQEYVPIPRMPVPIIQDKKVVVKSQYFNLSPFVMNGQFAGILGRVSDNAVIDIKANGGVLPILHH